VITARLAAVACTAACWAHPAPVAVPAAAIATDADGWAVIQIDALSPADAAAACHPGALDVRVTEHHAIDPALPAMAGEIRCERTRVVFRPLGPLDEGLPYRIALTVGDRTVVAAIVEHRPTAPVPPTTRVASIAPTSDVVPANLLRFRLRFTASMSEGDAFERVRIVDAQSGRALDHPWHEAEVELWDPARRELTLLLDPGRIKRGLARTGDPRGALVPGRHYRLEVEAGWRDATGRPLVAPFHHAFAVVDPDRVAPDPRAFRIAAPRAGTREPVGVTFDEALDSALVQAGLAVVDAAGAPIVGEGHAEPDGRSWSFVPARPWPTAELALALWPRLADLAGNELGRLFDRAVGAPATIASRHLTFAPQR